jgi:predicted tellurium resistance membrane protein TerC
MDLLLEPQTWLAFFTLAALETVLGIDNIVLISILVGRLPRERRPLGRNLGLGVAMATRILLLLSITWVMGLIQPLFSLLGRGISGLGLHIPKGYVYFAKAFSVGVELLNMRVRRRAAVPVHLRGPRFPGEEERET